MYKLAKVFLFSLQPEQAHYLTMRLLKWGLLIPGLNTLIKKSNAITSPKLSKKILGLSFFNPVGLAAGFDKDGKFFSDIQHLGFGFIEIGTVTPKSQLGNPKPRLFRIREDEALINRMGFNNEGVDALVERLKVAKKTNVIIGGNIGKNKDTPNENALDDYLICLKALHDYVDYFVVNVSSPNTPNLRSLQDKEPLMHLLKELKTENATYNQPKPILLKIAPDVTEEQLSDIIEVVRSTNIEGVIATNTTISRANLKTNTDEIKSIGNGGLSGKPLTTRSTQVIKSLRAELGNDYVIIGVGGIHSEQDALDKLDAGADLIQLYTGFIYEGPNLIKRINKAILVRK